jgi:hypothetical protein
MLGQYQPLSTYHLPSAPILTVPIPNLPISVAEKALEINHQGKLKMGGGIIRRLLISNQRWWRLLTHN